MFWIRVTVVLAGVWLLAAGIVAVVRSAKPTPETIAAYVAEHPLDGSSESERAKTITSVAERLNRLDFEQRRDLRRSAEMDTFFESMTDAERSQFLDLTLPEGFRQMMLALNKMTPENRKKIVDRALADIADGPPGETESAGIDEAQREKIIGQGMSAFYEEASADVKLDFAPVIEQIQRSLQHLE